MDRGEHDSTTQRPALEADPSRSTDTPLAPTSDTLGSTGDSPQQLLQDVSTCGETPGKTPQQNDPSINEVAMAESPTSVVTSVESTNEVTLPDSPDKKMTAAEPTKEVTSAKSSTKIIMLNKTK